MPYSVVHQGKKWFVKNKATNELRPKDGYDTKGEAQNYLQALETNAGDTAKKGEADQAASTLSRRGDCEYIPVRSVRGGVEITGYLAIWGSPTQKDCLGTWFDRNRPPQMDLDFLPLPLRYGHGQDPQIGKEAIGKVDQVWLDEVGIPFHAVLDDSKPYYPRIYNEIRDGFLATSSGTTEYLAEFADDGRFVNWPVAELSLTDKPCELKMPAVAAVRSMPESHRIQLQIKPMDQPSGSGAGGDPWGRWREQHARASGEGSASIRSSNMPKAPTRVAKRAPKLVPTDGGSEGKAAAIEPADNTDGKFGEKRAPGLTLEMLGLDGSATIADVYEALCALVGDSAANAIIEDMQGPGAEFEEEDGLDGMKLSERAAVSDFAPDPNEDDRPIELMGDEEIEDITDGENDGSQFGEAAPSMGKPIRRSSNLQDVLRQGLKRQSAQTRPQKRSAPDGNRQKLAELQTQNRLLRRMLLNQPVEDRPAPRHDRRDQIQPTRRVPNIQAKDLQYDMCSAADLALTVKMMDSVGKQPSPNLLRAASYKIAQEIEKSTPTGSDMTVQYMTPFRSISECRSMDVVAYRANEVMGDGNTNFGSNYVGVFYDTSMWLKVRAMPVWRMMEERGLEEKVIPVGYASDVIPLEGADFTWYRVPETVDVDATGRPKINITPSKAGTSSSTLTVRTLGALVYYSVLLEEDSIVPMAAELNRKANIEVQEQIENVIFNGDTATGTGNLNLKNGTVAASDVYNFTVADGMLKAAIYGNSGLNARAAASFSDLDFQLLFGLLGNNGITGSDPTKLVFFVDPQTGLAADRLPIFKTKDINNAATIEKGHVTEVYNVPIWRSGQIALADLTGYIDSVTAANNKFGRILCVRPDQWVIGFKRQVTLEYFRDVPGQSNGMVITLRMGLQNRDATQAASASYNITVK